MLSYKTHVISGLFNQTSYPCSEHTDLTSPAARKLRDWWWREAQAGIPRKRCFDIIDHFDAAPDLFLIEVLAGDRFRTRIIGEQAKTLVEDGRAGAIISQDNPQKFLKILWEHYTEVVSRKEPIMCRGYVEYKQDRCCLYEGLDCPLSSDGNTVTHIIGILNIFG